MLASIFIVALMTLDIAHLLVIFGNVKIEISIACIRLTPCICKIIIRIVAGQRLHINSAPTSR